MKKSRVLSSLIILTLYSAQVRAGDYKSISYQGRILKPTGQSLEGNVNFQVRVRSENSGCILWAENKLINLAADSLGAFNMEIGTGINVSTGAHSFEDSFDNAKVLTGLSGCNSGTTFTANTATEDRVLEVSFNDGSGAQTLPNISIRAVPLALVASQSRTSLGLANFGISLATPTNGQVLQFNSTSQKWEPATVSGGGGSMGSLASGNIWVGQSNVATAVTVSGDATLSSAGVLTLSNSGVSAGTYPRVTVDVKGRVIAAGTLNISDIPNLNLLLPSQTGNSGKFLSSDGTTASWASQVLPTLSTITGLLSAAKGGTGIDSSSAANGQLLIGNGTGFTLATLNISNGLSLSNSAGAISLSTNANTLRSNDTLVSRNGSGVIAAAQIDTDSVLLPGSVSGSVTVRAPSSPTTYTMTLPSSAGSNAQVLATDGSGGLGWANEIKFGNSSSTCNATNEGQQRYNSGSKLMEFCNGTGWIAYTMASRTSCPAGFTLIGTAGSAEAFCISTNAETTATWVNAATACYNKTISARLCSLSEWAMACVAGASGPNNMTGHNEWISDLTGNSGQVAGNSGCASFSGQGVGSSMVSRCCFR